MGRIAGLDVGERRIGVAVSDATGTLARPVGVVQTQGWTGTPWTARRPRLHGLRGGGRPGRARRRAASPARWFRKRHDAARSEVRPNPRRRTSLPVVLQDERLTSVEAESRLALGRKTGECGRHDSMPPLQQSSCRTISTAGREETPSFSCRRRRPRCRWCCRVCLFTWSIGFSSRTRASLSRNVSLRSRPVRAQRKYAAVSSRRASSPTSSHFAPR